MSSNRICLCYGFTRWKRGYIKRFYPECSSFKFFDTLESMKSYPIRSGDTILVWGLRDNGVLDNIAKADGCRVIRVEDGFIRSLSLGSDLTMPYSLVFDDTGIYFNPKQSSSLETILNSISLNNTQKKRAAALIDSLIKNRISKYNISSNRNSISEILGQASMKQHIILVPGQVEDDASVIYGAEGMNNEKLLIEARKARPDSFIIYKPHPDVVAGNRKGEVSKDILKKCCDLVVEDISVSDILDICDEVHTITSLVGFEALVRSKAVYTYGIPFYAGWGLSRDREECKRRDREISLEELVYGTLILYPRYISPKNNSLCEAEETLEELAKVKRRYNNDSFYRLRTDMRNRISRYAQRLMKVVGGE